MDYRWGIFFSTFMLADTFNTIWECTKLYKNMVHIFYLMYCYSHRHSLLEEEYTNPLILSTPSRCSHYSVSFTYIWSRTSSFFADGFQREPSLVLFRFHSTRQFFRRKPHNPFFPSGTRKCWVMTFHSRAADLQQLRPHCLRRALQIRFIGISPVTWSVSPTTPKSPSAYNRKTLF